MAWGDCLGPVVVTTHLSACGCGALFPSVRKILCAGHLQGQDMCRHQEFGSSQRRAERRELLSFTFQLWYQPQPIYPFLPVCKPEGQSRSVLPGRCAQVLAFPDTVATLLWLRALGRLWTTSMAPLFPSFLLFLTMRGPSRNLKGQGVSLLAPSLPGCHGSHPSTMAAPFNPCLPVGPTVGIFHSGGFFS